MGIDTLTGHCGMIPYHTGTTGVAAFISSCIFTKGVVTALSQTAQGLVAGLAQSGWFISQSLPSHSILGCPGMVTVFR